MKKFLSTFVILSVVAVLLCGSFCMLQATLHPHCTGMSHSELNQINSPEAKLDLKTQTHLLAVIDPKEIKEACRTKNIHLNEPAFSFQVTQQHSRDQWLQHFFSGSKDFI